MAAFFLVYYKLELELRRVKTCHLSSAKTVLIPEKEVENVFCDGPSRIQTTEETKKTS